MFVYLIHNTVNGKYYVGKWQGANLNTRWRMHLNDARRGSTTYLHRAIRKYGADKFQIHPVMSTITSVAELARWESELISLFKANDRQHGYNLTRGGDGLSGYKHSATTRQVMSEKAKAWFATHPHPRKGTTASQDERLRMSERVSGEGNPNFGKPRTQESLNKLRLSNERRGRRGLYFNKVRGKWIARIWHGGKGKYLGQFDTEQEALDARNEAVNRG